MVTKLELSCCIIILLFYAYLRLDGLIIFITMGRCRNPSICLATKARGLRGCEVAGLEVDPGVTSHAPGSAKSPKSVRE